MCVLSRFGWYHKGFYMPKDSLQGVLILGYSNVTSDYYHWCDIIYDIFHGYYYAIFFMCATVPL